MEVIRGVLKRAITSRYASICNQKWVTTHTFRHWFATHLLEDGYDKTRVRPHASSLSSCCGLRAMHDGQQIFLCYAKEDRPSVRELYARLCGEGFLVWFDQEKLLPGQDWDAEIAKAIRKSRLFLACLSPSAVAKKGFIHRELREAQRVHQEFAAGSIYLIPVLLEPCEVPESLKAYQWADLSSPDGLEKLMTVLRDIIGEVSQSPLRSRAEALYGGYLIRVSVVDGDTGAPIAGARVEVNEVDSTREDVSVLFVQIFLREHLAGRTGKDGVVYSALPRLGEALYSGTRYVASAAAPGYGIQHVGLKYRQDLRTLARLDLVAHRTGLVFESGEVAGLKPNEEAVLRLPRTPPAA